VNRVLRLLPVATVSLVLLTGCGGDGSDASPAPSSPATSSGSSSPSASASEQASPSVAPATGERVSLKSLSFTLPAGYTKLGADIAGGRSWASVETLSTLSTFEFPNVSGDDLDSLVQRETGQDPQLVRQPDRTLDGQVGYALAGPGATGWTYQWGTTTGDQQVSIELAFESGESPEAQAVVDSVLASVTVP